MNLGIVVRTLGLLLLAVSLVGMIPLAVDWAALQPMRPWLWMCAVGAGTGILAIAAGRRRTGSDVGPREGAAITVGAWLCLAAMSSIGLRLAIPGSTPVECWFESMSGLTTCGSSAFGEHLSVDAMTPGVKIWRALLQWMGGVGVIALGLVLLPMLSGGASFQLFRSEASGLALDRLTPRLGDTVRFILVYNLMLNLIVAGALALCGLDWFDAVCHALATVSTGGFSTHDAGITALASPRAEWVLSAGMAFAGVNFAMVVAALRGQPRALWRSEEVRAYLTALLLSAAVVAVVLVLRHPAYAHDGVGAVRHAVFAVTSLATSTGFTVGFEHDPHGWGGWPAPALVILLLCTLGLGCTGSTVGGAKMARIIILGKTTRQVLMRFVEPARVAPATCDGRPLAGDAVPMALVWFTCFGLSLVLGTLVLLLLAPLDLGSAASVVYASLTNAGPGLGQFSPERSAQAAGPAGMVLLSLLMLLGRLEFLAVLVLLSRRTWRR